MLTTTISTNSAAATEVVGRTLGTQLPERVVLTLTGRLGSGKTTLIRGLVAARSSDPVSSPTYVYHARYQMPNISGRASDGSLLTSDLRPPTSGVIDHVDLYRVHADPSLRSRSAIDELLSDVPGWLVIEWPLADLCYPTDVPLVQIRATGPPDYHFAIQAPWPFSFPSELSQ